MDHPDMFYSEMRSSIDLGNFSLCQDLVQRLLCKAA